MKFALLSVTYGGLFYKGPALSLEQQIHRAKEFGFDALAKLTLSFNVTSCEGF